ncbi:MAG TPA: phosphate acyltransferase [Vicinamibacterales bacterium]|nr:phosphate acyltransferase [Vicinamibacterales bacterium]HOQ61213.1 phosphate acyltransferase [Vicinamibacterales bacterium]HPK71089.1 phosphate acyltransferase [Vicinamibacterales bacterium]
MLTSHAEIRTAARQRGPLRVAVVDADDDVALTAAALAAEQGIATAVLVGDEARIRERAGRLGLDAALATAEYAAADAPAAAAARLAADGGADMLLKGRLRTDELMRAVLDKSLGLRTGRLLSDVLLYEDVVSGTRRLVGVTDGGLNVAPDLAQKKQIVLNAIGVLRAVGLARPKIAILSATEAVSAAVPSTVDARALTEMGEAGEFGDADVFGPLALDNALLESAARGKGITHPVAGHADCLVVANIETGNALAKAAKYLAGSSCAHVVVGARLPILIPSRVESAEDKLNAIALGVLVAGR